jgi:hypothetical protein
VLHAPDQATVAGVCVTAELDDEDALVGKYTFHGLTPITEPPRES